MTARKYTWKPDLPDQRDHLYGAIHGTAVSTDPLPPSVDLSQRCPPVFDQGQLGSCTGNALAAAMDFIHPQLNGSRLFIYYNERLLEGTVRTDSGAMIRDGVKTLTKQGLCSETVWPYDVQKFRSRPPLRCYALAATSKVSSYTRLQTLDEMLHCLASGFPFAFGFTVYDSFKSDSVAQTGILNMPAISEQTVGGHAVLAVGYDMTSRRIKVRNSWGPNWGQQGYFTMPFDYVANRSLSDDFWTIRA